MTTNWLERTMEALRVPDKLIERYGEDYIDKICQGEMYEQAQAIIALALDKAIERTDLNARKKRRLGPQMASWILNGAAVVFMLGYLQAKDGNLGGNDGQESN